MTDIDYMIAVMQAAKEGKAIQSRARGNRGTDDNWVDAPSPIWNWATFDGSDAGTPEPCMVCLDGYPEDLT